MSERADATFTLPAAASSVRVARQLVRPVLPSAGIRLGDILLLTSELVSNVVRHADTEVTLTIHLGPPIRVEVTDAAAANAPFRELILGEVASVPSTQVGGRGIGICRTLATRVGLDEHPDGGNTVWFEI